MGRDHADDVGLGIGRGNGKGCVEGDIVPAVWREVESVTHDADDSMVDVVDGDPSTQRAGVAGKPGAPSLMRENHDRLGALFSVVFDEEAPDGGRCAQEIQEGRCDPRAPCAPRHADAGHGTLAAADPLKRRRRLGPRVVGLTTDPRARDRGVGSGMDLPQPYQSGPARRTATGGAAHRRRPRKRPLSRRPRARWWPASRPRTLGCVRGDATRRGARSRGRGPDPPAAARRVRPEPPHGQPRGRPAAGAPAGAPRASPCPHARSSPSPSQ